MTPPRKKTAAELLKECETAYEKLPILFKTQAGGVLIPLIGSLRALSAEQELQKQRIDKLFSYVSMQ